MVGPGRLPPSQLQTWRAFRSRTHTNPITWRRCQGVPVPADYDGDRKFDPPVFRPSTGGWFVLKSSTNYSSSFGVSWGLSTDVPIDKRPQP